MCLSSVDKKQKADSGIGYKVLNRVKNKYYSWDFMPKAGLKYPRKRWLKDESRGKIVAHSQQEYLVGYHIALSPARENCHHCDWGRNLVDVRVKFRKVVATGFDSSYGDVVVAREMMLLGEC